MVLRVNDSNLTKHGIWATPLSPLRCVKAADALCVRYRELVNAKAPANPTKNG